MYAQSSASGTLTIGKDNFEIRYAAAMLVRDPHDLTKTKTVTRIVLTDKPVSEDWLDDEGQLWNLKDQGFHGLQVEISQDKRDYHLSAISATLGKGVSYSPSGTLYGSGAQITILTGKQVEGAIEMAPQEHEFPQFDAENVKFRIGYSVKFAAKITPPAAAPTAADAAAAAGKESTKAYLAEVEAIRSGNKQRIMPILPPEMSADMDKASAAEFSEALKFLQSGIPSNPQVLKATETGDDATLLVRDLSDKSTPPFKIHLNRVNGKWRGGF